VGRRRELESRQAGLQCLQWMCIKIHSIEVSNACLHKRGRTNHTRTSTQSVSLPCLRNATDNYNLAAAAAGVATALASIIVNSEISGAPCSTQPGCVFCSNCVRSISTSV
jgi:hypothetical protein